MKKLLVLIIFIVSALKLSATTWFPKEVLCPVCKHKNTFQQIGSYGSYIYSYPSKYQSIFWPITDENSVYCCTECNYSTFIGDFDSLPHIKIDSLKAFLKLNSLGIKTENYTKIPFISRLELAEKIYNLSDISLYFKCYISRVKGYHYANADEKEKSVKARMDAISFAQQMLNDSTYEKNRKEALFIIGSMFKFIEKPDSATKYLDLATSTPYGSKTKPNKDDSNANDYYNKLIAELKEKLNDNLED